MVLRDYSALETNWNMWDGAELLNHRYRERELARKSA